MAELSEPAIAGKFTNFEITSSLRKTGRVLGRGSVATVVEVEWNGALCAAKEFHFEECFQAEERTGEGRKLEKLSANYLQECETWFAHQSCHIAQVMGVVVKNPPVVVMEKMDCSLQDYLGARSRSAVPLRSKIHILRQVVDALSYLHTRRPCLVHGDARPCNVLLSGPQARLLATLADFGHCRALLKSGFAPASICRTMQAYLPPQHLERHDCEPKCDIFSFGNIIIFTLTHRHFEPSQPTAECGGDIEAPSELQKRKELISLFEPIERHLFFDVVRSCLENSPLQCLSSLQLAQKLAAVENEYSPQLLRKASPVPGEQDQKQLWDSAVRGSSKPLEHLPSKESDSCSVEQRKTVSHHRKMPPSLTLIYPLHPPPTDGSSPDWEGAKSVRFLAAPSQGDVCSTIAVEGDTVAMGLQESRSVVLCDRKTGARVFHFHFRERQFGRRLNGLAFLDKGNIAVSDTQNGTVKIFSTRGVFVRAVDRGIDTGFCPQGLAVGPNRFIYVCDDFSKSVCVFTGNAGVFVKCMRGGKPESKENVMDFPRDVCFASDKCMYVTDSNLGKVFVFNPNGHFVESFSTTWQPYSIAAMPSSLHLVITSWMGGKVMVYSVTGEPVHTFTHFPPGLTLSRPRITFPKGVAVDCDGQVYVTPGTELCKTIVFKV